jgi:Uma2 family endonuclease
MFPQRQHSWLQSRLIEVLHDYQGLTGGRVGPEATIEFLNENDRRDLVPDVAYWAPGKPVGGPYVRPPTLAVEVLSVGQPLSSQQGKCRYYRRNGVDAAWMVDPESRTVEVFDAARDGDVLRETDTLSSAALPGFELPLTELFSVLDEE